MTSTRKAYARANARARRAYPTLAARRAFCAAPCSLNGYPARVTGAQEAFATITDLASGLGAQWSWFAVERVLSGDGAFRS